ncbi:MAG: SDR family oxidoreductase [Deltaproteobacteria bacterium]|nr:SDR family oxidoreductase [Deltaproteobacteria bacterium]
MTAPRQPRSSRRVLVVGATGRLGVAIAEALADRGDEVVLTARDPNKLEALAAAIGKRSGGPAAKFVCADLAHRDAVETVVQGLRAQLPPDPKGARGYVDDIVLACGPFPRTPFQELRREDLERTLTVHAVAPLLLVHALAGDLAKAKGAVVALGDAGTTRPFEHHVAYLTAKGAVKTGLRALAVELSPDVRVNIVELGIVADPEADADPLRQHRLATRSQLGRFGTPADVVHVVLSLLDATWATGEIWGIGR